MQIADRVHESRWRYSQEWREGWRQWTRAELDKLEALAGDHTVEEIAEEMGRTVASIRAKGKRIGLSLNFSPRLLKKRELSKVIIEEYKRKTIKEIALDHGLTYHQVYRIVIKKPGK